MERSNSFSSTGVSYQQLDNDVEAQDDHHDTQNNQSTNPSADQSSNQPTASLHHPKITICFRTLSGQVMRIELPTFLDQAGTQSVYDLTVYGLKQELERCHQIPVHFSRLIFGGRELTDDQTLRQANIEDQAMIHLLLRQNSQPPPGVHPDVTQPNMMMPPGFGFDHQSVDIADPIGNYNEDVELIYQLGRSIKVLSLIDALWLILISMRMSYFFNFGLCLAIIGFIGVQLYRRDLSVALLGFICLSIASRIYYMMDNPDIAIYIFLSLAIVIDVYLMRLVVMFIKKLRGISPADRSQLLARNRMRMNAF